MSKAKKALKITLLCSLGMLCADSLAAQDRREKMMAMRRRTAQAVEEERKKELSTANILNAIQEKIFDPITNAFNSVADTYKGFSVKLRELASMLRKLPDDIKNQLKPVFTAPQQLQTAAQQIDTDFIKQINDTLVQVDAQRKEVAKMNLSSMGIEELNELEKSLLKAFDELEKFLRTLLATLNEIKDALNKTIDPVNSGIKSIENNLEALRGRIAKGELGYSGLPERLEGLAKVLNP